MEVSTCSMNGVRLSGRLVDDVMERSFDGEKQDLLRAEGTHAANDKGELR